jgi:aspartate kinase
MASTPPTRAWCPRRAACTISFEEMLEMASLGSKVLQIRSVEFAGKYKVPMRVLSSFTPWDIDIDEEAKSGTLITLRKTKKWNKPSFPASRSTATKPRFHRAGRARQARHRLPDPGPVADANIEVDVIIQNVSKDGKTDFSFTVHRNDYAAHGRAAEDKVVPAWARRSGGRPKICKVSIVGIGMRSHVGVASKMFRT